MLNKRFCRLMTVLIALILPIILLSGCTPVQPNTEAPPAEDLVIEDTIDEYPDTTDIADIVDNSEEPISKDYRAKVGDILQITALPDPEKISREDYEVAADGSIKMIYINNVIVAGLTKAEIEEVLDEKYAAYYKDVRFSVNILRFYYISGEIRQPNRYQLMRRVNLTEALDTAGGFTDFAKETAVIITRIVNGETKRIKVNCRRIREGKIDDVIVKPDDRIYVPRGGL